MGWIFLMVRSGAALTAWPWVAAGAHGETLVVPNAGRHLVNNLNWVTLMQEEGRRLRGGFRGLVITGQPRGHENM